MEQLAAKPQYEKVLRDYSITDCAVRSKRFLYLIARNSKESARAGPISEATVTKRLIAFYPDKLIDSRLGQSTFRGYDRLMVSASQFHEDKAVCVTSGGDVFAVGGGTADDEADIPKHRAGPRRGAIQRIRMIHAMLYAVGSGHTVCRRRGRNDWESMCLDLPQETRADFDDVNRAADMAFEDIDGFAHDDLYAVAGRGRVWHCDGKQWKKIAFPSNMLLNSVCCAGDGQVYIGAQSGTVFRGRGGEWQMIERGAMTLPFQDIVWHAGRVWCTSDYGLWSVEGDRVVKADVPSEIMVCAGNLSAADGVMLMAGSHGAAFHDGRQWQLIFNRLAMES